MKSLASPVFNLKGLEFGAFFAYFHLFWYLKIVQLCQNCADTFHFRQAFRPKNCLKIALQVSKLAWRRTVNRAMPVSDLCWVSVCALITVALLAQLRRFIEVRWFGWHIVNEGCWFSPSTGCDGIAYASCCRLQQRLFLRPWARDGIAHLKCSMTFLCSEGK